MHVLWCQAAEDTPWERSAIHTAFYDIFSFKDWADVNGQTMQPIINTTGVFRCFLLKQWLAEEE
jgi:hypothetical protein